MKKVYYYLFYDKITDEYFSVCGINTENASRIAQENFESPVYCGKIDEELVDMSGEDAY